LNELNIISAPLPKLKFDKNRRRVKFCPCGKDNKDDKFVPYIGFEDKGYCHSCGETFLPEIQKEEQFSASSPQLYLKPKAQRKIDYLPFSEYKKQMINGKYLNDQNNFFKWLTNPLREESAFDERTLNMLSETYMLGNSKKYKGWVLFPYIDTQYRLCDIKAMDYNPDTGKRISYKNGDNKNRCHFIGKTALNNPDANTTRCFFGEHLLLGNIKAVKLFESEATAVYAAAFYPDSVCLATGGSNGCKWTDKDKCSVLLGRTVILYPDIDAYDDWESKAEILKGYGIDVKVSQLIKDNAKKFAVLNEIEYVELEKQKFDLRDILKHQNMKEFLVEDSELPAPIHSDHPKILVKASERAISSSYFKNKSLKPDCWRRDIQDLETFFSNIEIPKGTVHLNQSCKITDCSLFIESNMAFVKANNGKRIFLPYLEQLTELKNHLSNND
jgi:hypothetical protein